MNEGVHDCDFLLLEHFRFCYTSVAHPFRVFLRNGWETAEFPVYTILENALFMHSLPVAASKFGFVHCMIRLIQQL